MVYRRERHCVTSSTGLTYTLGYNQKTYRIDERIEDVLKLFNPEENIRGIETFKIEGMVF